MKRYIPVFLSLFLAAVFAAGSLSCVLIRRGVEVAWGVMNPETPVPTEFPTAAPSASPEAPGTEDPVIVIPTPDASAFYTAEPTELPTPVPTEEPTEAPTAVPTAAQTPAPTAKPTPAPTAKPTATPKPTQTAAPKPTAAPTATPKPTATPAPAGDGSITYVESKSLPLPGYYSGEKVPQGQPFTFGGVVKSSDPITEVKLVISGSGGYTYSKSVTFDASEGRTAVELVDRTFPASGNNSLTAKVKFQDLASGSYSFALYASTSKAKNALLLTRSFKIVGGEWRELISNNLRNSFAYALQFFGSRDEFMFTYKWKASTGRDIELQGGLAAWESAHMTVINNATGGKWEVHKKAAPGFNKAVGYLKTAHLRVHGTNGDSGVIKLSSLIKTFDGIWNPRFVSDRSFVSHHAFGAAIDLNASLDANVNSLSNRTLIKNEVGGHLTYNGIKTASDGTKYYDFTYDGSHSSEYLEVPTTVINYLLYELAFYRAGFNWGYYYDHTCDAMHFGLSEFSADVHNTSSRSLRKVHSYID